MAQMDYFNESLIIKSVSRKKDGPMKLPSGLKNRTSFLKEMELDPEDLITPILEHGSTIRRVGKFDKIVEGCDGIVTDEKGVILSVTVADCLPIFLFDPQGEAIGLIHAGWRGLSEGIIDNAVKLFLKEFNSRPEKMIAIIGPGLCRDHFEVGQEVASKFELYPQNITINQERIFVDIKGIAKVQLEGNGLISENIRVNSDCTFCLDNEYFSYRRGGPDKEIETMLCVLTLKR